MIEMMNNAEMGRFIDLTGQKFGRLTVIERLENHISPNGTKSTKWRCECECGSIVDVLGKNLRNEITQSCGCLQRERATVANTTHGHYYDRLHSVWHDMKDRCYNPNNKYFRLYGAECKAVCDEWQTFEGFYKWAINGYREGLTIERIDGSKGYSPENCRWATPKEQSNNTRRNHFIEYNGKTQTMAQWADEYAIPYGTLERRINCYHWNIEKALTTK